MGVDSSLVKAKFVAALKGRTEVGGGSSAVGERYWQCMDCAGGEGNVLAVLGHRVSVLEWGYSCLFASIAGELMWWSSTLTHRQMLSTQTVSAAVGSDRSRYRQTPQRSRGETDRQTATYLASCIIIITFPCPLLDPPNNTCIRLLSSLQPSDNRHFIIVVVVVVVVVCCITNAAASSSLHFHVHVHFHSHRLHPTSAPHSSPSLYCPLSSRHRLANPTDPSTPTLILHTPRYPLQSCN